MIRPPRRHSAGFTLMEVLVVMTVMGLLMPLIYANISSGVTAWVQGQTHASHAEKVQTVQTWLRRQLGQAYPKFIAASDIAGHVDFVGHGSSLQFISPMPEAIGGGGWARTTLTISPDDTTGLQLTMAQRPELAWSGAPEASKTSLLRGLKSAAFLYYGADDRWHDDWVNEKELPRLIKLQIEFADGKRLWPEFVVAPIMTADAGCIYDPLTKFCRGR